MTTNTIKESVRRGVELLNDKVPNWWEKIDLSYLLLSSGLECVLGQLFLEYQQGLDCIDIEDDNADYYGFNVGTVNKSTEDVHNEWLELQDEWVKTIKELKKGNV